MPKPNIFLVLLSNLDLKARIAVFTAALFVGAIWLLAQDLVHEVSGDFQKVLSTQQSQFVEHIADSLDSAFNLRINALVDAASLIKPEWMASPDLLHAFLAERRPLYRFFDAGIFVISRKGIGVADLPNLEGREGASYAERDYYREVVATGKPVVGKPIMGRFLHKPVILVGVPIRGSRNEIIGVLVGDSTIHGDDGRITENDLFSEVSPRKMRMYGDTHVISPKDGLIVVSTDKSRILQPEPAPGVNAMYDRYRQGFEGSGIAVNTLGVENLSSAKRMQTTGWLVIATLPTATAFHPIVTLQREIYRDAALSSVVIILLLWFFLHHQLRPLSRSAQIIDDMASARTPLRLLPLEGSKEIRRLLGSFNRLQQHIGEQAQSLRENAEQMQLSASVFEGTSEAILISDSENRILNVNRAFCQLTGYDRSELIGRNPKVLKSGRHNKAFYQEMWSTLLATGQWQGEIWNRRKNREVYPERLNISILRDEQGRIFRHIAIAADITKQKEAEELIWKQANYSPLTDLPNRRLLLARMQQELEKSSRQGLSVAVLHVDLDRFNEWNNMLGHSVGDQIIVEAARRICSCVNTDSDTVAHLGGDRFAVMLRAMPDSSSRAEQTAGNILRAIGKPFRFGRETAYDTACIGIALFPVDGGDSESLMKNADQALHDAKFEGHDRYCRYSVSMHHTAQAKLQLANDLRGALAANQLEVYYQPIVELDTGRIAKAEALLRWHHPERGTVSPADFIPIAEETGLINEIGDWVFKEAVLMAKCWCSNCELLVNGVCTNDSSIGAGSETCRYQISINKSPRQFLTGNTDKTWVEYLRDNNISPRCITIEITEGMLLDRHSQVMEKFLAFQSVGMQVAIDDFGTGYSAMSYLNKFDIDYLKIDRSFVQHMATSASGRSIVEALILMAHKLGLRVVAEGVETLEQHVLLVAAGCDYGQGYLFAKPMPTTEFEKLIAVGSTRHIGSSVA